MRDLSGHTCIASWIVLDDKPTATDFPSVGTNSADPGFQMVYWRCLAVCFFTARIQNEGRRLLLFCNYPVSDVAPPEIVAFLDVLGVETVTLPIRHRLPVGAVSRWGNQFYVLDVVEHFATHDIAEAVVLTDSDCIWRKSLMTFERDIFEHRSLLYTLAPADQKSYEVGNLLNGMSHARMADVATRHFEAAQVPVEYHGGEFLAATKEYCQEMLPHIERLWETACAEVDQPDSIKEEAHFLSIIAHGLGIKTHTATRVIRRMWTNFHDVNIVPQDLDLVLWHLPAEKKFGFRRLWRRLQAEPDPMSMDRDRLNFLTATYMGVPRRSASKVSLDVTSKLLDRVGVAAAKLTT